MPTRRTLLRSTVVGTTALIFPGSLAGLRAAVQTTPPLRRSLGEMDLDDPDLMTYREFVTMMKDPARSGDPVNWVSFSGVHGTWAGFNLCPHGNWYFAPWHRGYLRMYEAAARALTGNRDFALPYWDWTTDRQMPRSFSDENFNGRPNPLFVQGRSMGPNDSLPDEIVGEQKVMDGIYDETIFEAFGSSRPEGQNSLDPMWVRRSGISSPLEATPHNNIHGIVGGLMESGASPQDPIFLMHHCNVDRIWAVWNSLGRVNTPDPLWLDMPFTDHFIAPDGTTYTDVVSDLQEVVSVGYTYGLEAVDESPDPSRTLHLSSLFGAPEALARTGYFRFRAMPTATADPQRPLSVPLSPDAASLRRSVHTSVNESTVAAGMREPQVYAIIRDLDPTMPESTQLRVFVNCGYLSQAVPTSDPHYVTTIGFFGAGGEHKLSSLVNLTAALKRLARGQRLDTDQVVVQLLPTQQYGNTLDNAGSVAAGEIELAIV